MKIKDDKYGLCNKLHKRLFGGLVLTVTVTKKIISEISIANITIFYLKVISVVSNHKLCCNGTCSTKSDDSTIQEKKSGRLVLGV